MSLIDNPPRQLRALIYNRVSSDPTGKGISVDSQEGENRAFCARQDWEVAGVVTDNDRSASRHAVKEREGYQQVRQALAGSFAGYGRIDVLVAWESSRNQRDLADYVTLRDLCANNDVLLAYKGRVYDMSQGDDRFTTGIDALVDERESERIRDRALRGHRNSAAKGRPRGQVPYGYRREYDPHTGYLQSQAPDPVTAPIVQEIVARILMGETLYKIALDLNERGVLSPQALKEQQAGIEVSRWGWTSSKIRRLMSTQSNIGIRTHHGVPSAVSTWDPIVSADDFRRVRAILDDPKRAVNHRGVEPKYLLSGIAECGVCGAWLRPQMNRTVMSYICAGREPGGGKGHVVRAHVPLDALVTVEVVKQLRDPGLIDALARRQASGVEVADDARRELADLQARLTQFEEAAMSADGPSAASFTRISSGLIEEMSRVRGRLVAAAEVPQVVLDAAGPDAQERWDARSGDLPWQRQVLRALLRVVVHRSSRRRGVHGFDRSTIDVVTL